MFKSILTSRDAAIDTMLRVGAASCALAVACVLSHPAGAEEPSGCDAFKWSLTHEAELLQAAGKPALASGGAAQANGTAYVLQLVAMGDARLPQPPGRTPKSESAKAGYVRYAAPSSSGTVQITLSEGAWVDVLQDGASVKPSAFSGARDCPGVRKSLRFPLAASPFVVEISGTEATAMGIVAAPAP